MTHDGAVIISTKLDNTGLEKSIGRISGSLGGLKSVATKLGGIIATAFSVRAIVNFSKETINLGSDLQEVQNVVDVTFGSMSNTINEFAKNSITQFGLSKLAAKQYTSTMGAMLKSMGFGTEAVAGMSMKLAGLAGDMASFYNLDTDDAFAKIRAGISGETEPLKQLGINLSVANLEAYALAQGIGKSYSAMSQQEQALIRYNYLLSVTKDAQGDFARTSNSWANQTRILTEQFNSLKATIGQGLINVLTPLISVINTVLNGLQAIADSFKKLTALIFGDASGGNSAGSEAAAGFEAAETAAENYGKAATEAGKDAKKALAGFDEIQKLGDSSSGGGGTGGAGGSGSGAGASFGSIDVGGSVQDNISPKLQAIADKIRELLAPLKEIDFGPLKESLSKLGKAFEKLGDAIGDALEWAWKEILVPFAKWFVEEVAPKIVDALTEVTDLIADFVSLLTGDMSMREFLEELSTAQTIILAIAGSVAAIAAVKGISSVSTAIKGISEGIQGLSSTTTIGKVGELFAVLGGAAGPVNSLREAFEVVFGPVATTIAGIASVVGGAILAVTNFFSMLNDGFSWLNEILMVVGIALAAVGAILLGAPAAVAGVVAGIVAAVATLVVVIKDNWDAIVKWCQKACEKIGKFFTNAGTTVKKAWLAVKNWFNEKIITPMKKFFANLGTSIITAFNTAKTKVSVAWLLVKNWFNEKIVTPLKTSFTKLGTAVSTAFSNAKAKVQTAWLAVKNWFNEKIITPIKTFFTKAGTSISTAFANARSKVQTTWLAVKNWFKEKITDPISNTFTKVRTAITDAFTGAKNAVKNAWNSVSGWFKKNVTDPIKGMFSGIFSTVSNIFNGKITFNNITDSIKNKFKEFINKLISGLNSILSKVVSPINTIIRKLKNFEIFGAKPFYWSLWEIATPKIPYLAKGAVIPPNAPFMAVLGDQRHGTNIEAPLSTIQEAVALVMEDMIQSNLAGHEATVAVLQQILEAVLGIELDGSTISRAVNNYNRKMAVVKGGL